MDTRIILDMVRRWAWLWIIVIVVSLVSGFVPGHQSDFILAMPLIYMMAPMNYEFKKQGTLWVHRSLPVGNAVLARTGWVIVVILPVVVVMISLVPALVVGLLTGTDNLASSNLLPVLIAGLLWTSVCYLMVTLGAQPIASLPLRGIAFVGGILLAGATLLALMKAGRYWDILPLRVTMVAGAALVVPGSYLLAPLVLQGVVRSSDPGSPVRSGTSRSMYATSLWDRGLSSPLGRTLASGIWLVTFLFLMNLFYAFLSGSYEWWTFEQTRHLAPIGCQMLAMFLFFYCLPHLSSLRGLATLPISSLRRTATLTSLPLAATLPLTAAVAIQIFVVQGSAIELLLGLAVIMLYCLAIAYFTLAVCLRYGFIKSVAALILMGFTATMRAMLAGERFFAPLGGLDACLAVLLIAAALVWIHLLLSRHECVYRKRWMPAAFQKG